jgi:adenylyltransferase/sulfurtransferase
MLSDEQIERYSRQIILPQVGGKGQEQLLRSRVLVNSNSTIHIAALHYLAAAGVGTIGIVTSAPSPLWAALEASSSQDPFQVLARLNPDCKIIMYAEKELRSPHQFVKNYDIVLADTDLLHDACWAAKRSFLYASVSAEEAYLMHCCGDAPETACLRCTSFSPTVQQQTDKPLMEIWALFIGAHLATEAIKHLLALPCLARGTALRFQTPILGCIEETVEKSNNCILFHE